MLFWRASIALACLAAGLCASGCGGQGNSNSDGDSAQKDLAIPDAALDGPSGCGLRTCKSAGVECGLIGDGCEGSIDCGECPEGQYCGGGGPSLCGTGECVPGSCQSLHIGCGPSGDGCGGTLPDCGPCPQNQTCGGGGIASQCGSGGTCVPLRCNGSNCGPMADGCGNLIDCGSCPNPFYCGTAAPNQCGPPPCMPRDCFDQNIQCGPAGDGCGSSLDCGACPEGQLCGGAGTPYVCGAPPEDAGAPCIAKSCLTLDIGCGPAGDGCGGLLQCGNCANGTTCGGAGVGFHCGQPPACAPLNCKTLGFNCGPASDGCGGLLQCGMCDGEQLCGGGGSANVCGGGPTDAGVHLGACGDGGMSTVSGVVLAPNGIEPLYNALVYVADDLPPDFAPGVACGLCAAEEGLASTSVRTGPDGVFQLPVADGTRYLVLQLGRWRRVIDLNGLDGLMLHPCADNPLGPDQTHMPQNHLEGDIPLMALVTGQVDTLECVLRKIGISDSEFSLPAGGKRIQIYQDNGADDGPMTPPATALYSQANVLDAYDMVLLACDGHSTPKPADGVKNLAAYANAGGRVFATHFSYTFLDDMNSPFQATATWVPDSPDPTPNDLTPLVGTIDQDPMVNPKGADFAAWVHLVGADGPMPGTINILASRHDVDAVVAPSTLWIHSTVPATVQHYTFDTPVPQNGVVQPTCGRVLFSDFHVTTANLPPEITFPAECVAGPLTAQEKVLEFMLFDLSSCIGAPPPPGCVPRSCFNQDIQCGPAGDGCGNLIQGGCGTCPVGQSCGGGGIPSRCGASPMCMPRNCQAQKIACGPAGDGCGNLIDCGPCRGPDGGLCIPRKCAPADCGRTADGCGGLIEGGCGPCSDPCVPFTCKRLGFDCGPAGDGCGGLIDCGTCTPPNTCGGSGKANHCGSIG